MGKLFFEETEEEMEIEEGSSIQEACEEQGIPFCCTEGQCGTCVIRVTEGMENLSPMTEEEVDFLGPTEDERLACQCRLNGSFAKISY